MEEMVERRTATAAKILIYIHTYIIICKNFVRIPNILLGVAL